jgi:23S rRNA pseudouridine1911/1915/1917 synthase
MDRGGALRCKSRRVRRGTIRSEPSVTHGRSGRGAGPRIVHEDRDLVVLDKPAGLLTIATATERERTAYAWLRARLSARRPPERVFIVHRLDREASGLLVFAKTPTAKRQLQAQFASRAAGRVYVARVEGRWARDEESLRSYLYESRALRVHEARGPGRGQLAVTHVRVLRRRSHSTLLELRLDTGRKHQIRVQLSARGHPIAGDRRYGASTRGRLALHATRLAFDHPSSGKRLEFDSRAPRAVTE